MIHYNILIREKGEKGMGFNVMPVIAAIGLIVIVVVLLITKSVVKKGETKSIDIEKFNYFTEEIKMENAEMKKDIQVIKEKVEAIDKIMKDI